MSQGSVQELETLLADQPKNPLRPNQISEYQEERDRLQKIASAPPYVQADRGAAGRRLREVEQTLREQAPKPIENATVRDKVAKLAGEALEYIRSRMQPRSTMRRNPPGAVDRFLKGEGSKDTKRAIMAWKRAQFALHPDADSQDHANLELHRPEGTPDGAASFMADAQIPGHFAMSPQAKANWPLGEPTVKTATAHLTPAVEAEAEPQAEIQCECGCGKFFTPDSPLKRYINSSHRARAATQRRLRNEKAMPRVPKPADVVLPPDDPEGEAAAA